MGCRVTNRREYECAADIIQNTVNDPAMGKLPKLIAVVSETGVFSRKQVEVALKHIDDCSMGIPLDRVDVLNISVLYFQVLCDNNTAQIISMLRDVHLDECVDIRDMLLTIFESRSTSPVYTQ